MSEIIKCPNCKKEVPVSHSMPDDAVVKKMLAAPLDCNGDPILKSSERPISESKTKCCCYWCGATFEVPKSTPKPQKHPVRETTKPDANKKKKPSYIVWIILILLAVIVYFSFKSCSNDNEYSSDTDIEDFELDDLDIESVDYDVEAWTDESESGTAANDQSNLIAFASIVVNERLDEWNRLENKLNNLGAPLDYVQTNSAKGPETIKKDAEDIYSSIRDEANKLYEKIRDEHNKKYEALKNKKEKEYERIRDAAEKRYNNGEIDYSAYSAIRSSAYSEYSDIRSAAYSKYSDVRSAAYNRYDSIRSVVYKWKDKVRSAANGL